jgi:hypothetical protein
MKERTSTILILMIGLLFGSLVTSHDLKIIELTGLSMLAVCYASEILDGIKRLGTRPQVRAYVVPRYAKAHHHMVSMGGVKTIALAAGILFGALLLLLDALHRLAH